MKTNYFARTSNGSCSISKANPDQLSIKKVLSASKKRPQKSNTIIIGRYKWLQRNKLTVPEDMELANLCITIQEGKLIRAFYSNVLTHVIKKQRYIIQILN